MPVTGYGDLAQSMMMRRQMSTVKSDLDRLAQELSSGRKADVAQSLRGDFNMLNDVENQLSVLEGYNIATQDAQLLTDSVQSTMEQIQNISSELLSAAFSTASNGTDPILTSASDAAKQDFRTIVGMLNGQAADRSLFAGTATSAPALVSADDMLAQLSVAVAGSTSISDIVTAVDDWFMLPGGGFETGGYIGSTNDLSPFVLNENETAHQSIRADDPELRAIMRDTALAALINDPGLALDASEKKQLMEHVGHSLLADQDGLTEIRASLGYSQAQIDKAATRNSALTTSLTMAKNDLVGADMTEVAGELQATEVQLEMIYMITGRLSNLSLMDYMR